MKSIADGYSRVGTIIFLVAATSVALFLDVKAVRAQQDASLAGSVRDTSGAGIVAATIHIGNLET